MKILIVDDDVISRRIMKAICVRLGYKVVTAPDGVEALDIFQRFPIRIVISDWVMPKLDGVGLCKAIRSTPDRRFLVD